MTYSLHTAPDMARLLAVRLRDCRIIAHLTQEELAERADVSLSSLRRLERDGSGSLSALLKLAEVLDALDGFATLFPDRKSVV